MPTLKLLDELGVSRITAQLAKASGLGKYLPDTPVELSALRPIAAALAKPLAEAPSDPAAHEFTLSNAVSLGSAGELTLDAGVRAAVAVHQASDVLFPADDLNDAISVTSGTAYVSLELTPRLKAGLAANRGPLAFAFTAGASLSTRYCQPFDVAGRALTLGDALAETFQHAVLPADVDDVQSLPLGAFASVSGLGELQLSTTVDLASAVNPLATAGKALLGKAKITAGASVNVGAEFSASGAFELRVTRASDRTVTLSYYRKAGSALAINATASLGISATLGNSDVIKKFLAAVSADPEADLVALVNANLDDEKIETLQKAVKASVDRTLAVTAELQFLSVRQGQSLCTFEVDVESLNAAGRAAVQHALGGRLGAIQAAASVGAPGIRLTRVGVLQTKERRVTWRLNLFGILNVLSVSELIKKGSLLYDAATGTLNAADEIASRHLFVKTRPFEADGEKVRKLLFESVIVSAAYQASRVTSGVSLTCSCSHFESRAKTRPTDLRMDFNAIVGLGLADAGEPNRRIGEEHDFGASTFLVECSFGREASDALFLGPAGPLPRDYYERVGRNAMLALIPPDDEERAHRRAAVESESTWAALEAGGPAHMRVELARTLGDVRAEHIIGDYVMITWWADAMSRAATSLSEMRAFLGGRTADSLATDPQFLEKRKRLEEALEDVVKDSKARFGDPWGLLALDTAASRRGLAQATIVSPRCTATYVDRLPAAERAIPLVAAAAVTTRSRAVDLAARAAKRPFTAEERETLRRHTINLRQGALSSDGEFQTDEADVTRLFTELLPAEIEERQATGQPLQLMFYAHGGLVGERDGLEPVLEQLKFWRRNGVYPVYFVWETGLKETISDIVSGLGGTRDMAARNIGEDLADAVLEVAARPGGKPIWSQMKRSAETSVLDGGGALLVAQHARDLWNQHHAAMQMHVAGHSAGAIFHAHFVPCLLGQATKTGVPKLHVTTMQLLAPASTTALFKSKLKDLVGATKGVKAFAMYTMSKSFEQDDTAGPYRKSLLYLVSRAFETDQPASILGLEESLRQDVQLIRFFGLGGNQKHADLVFSKTSSTAPLRSRTQATSHGDFDNDAPTMNSVMRRMLDARDEDAIFDYVEEPIVDAPPRGTGVGDVIPFTGAAKAKPAVGGTLVAVPPGVRRALCVGIDKYADGYDLHGCVNDATNWQKALDRRGFDTRLLTNKEATRDAILRSLGALVQSAEAGDVVVFQFAGHGTQVDDLDADENDDGLDEAFCPVDFTDGRFLIDDDVREVLALLKEGVAFTSFIDCCHSGTITRAMVGGRPGRRPAGLTPRFVRYSEELSQRHRQFREGGGAERGERARSVRARPASAAGSTVQTMREVTFAACQPEEVAYERNGAGQFTTHALAVLNSSVALTNAEFEQRVTTAFGAAPNQRPHLDCADAARTRGLLEPLGGRGELAVG